MDFGTLLSVAQKNENKQTLKACYQTKFNPPKKETKQSKELSENIKKFLAKKEEEERRKALEEKRKKENLLALRDHKAQSRINKHLKVCKAANKSVLADAIDNQNTAVTIAGPSQCDEDDYGYVSQEASAFYNKLMNKYSSLPPEKPLFSNDGKKTVKDIASTKDRVRQALKQQELEETLPHKRKRKHKEVERSSQDDKTEDDIKPQEEEKQPEKEVEAPRPKKKCPPPIDFSELLKLAEKKQYEPIKIEPKPKEEPERLMTKKQLKEFAKEKDWREKKEQRSRNPESVKPAQASSESSKSIKPPLSSFKTPLKSSSIKTANDVSHEKTVTKTQTLPAITKKPADRPPEKSSIVNKYTDRSSTSKSAEKSNMVNRPSERNNGASKPADRSSSVHKVADRSNNVHKSMDRSNNVHRTADKTNNINRSIEKSNGISKNSLPKVSEKDAIAEERRKLEEEKRQLEEMRRSIEEEKKKLLQSKTKKVEDTKSSTSFSQKSTGSKFKEPIKPSSSVSKSASSKPTPTNTVKSKPLPPSDVKPRQFPPADVKPRQFPPADVKPRQFPPPDVRSVKKSSSSKLKVVPNKRRIYDDEDEDYDSELDDFIDDGPLEEGEDYSKYISEIFGYDKNRYRHLDDEDDAAMESSYSQQLKEEFVSTRIGIMEDLEDIRQENLEKKRKALMKKKR